MRGWPPGDSDHAPSCAELVESVCEACYDDPGAGLRQLKVLSGQLKGPGSARLLPVALWGQALLQRTSGAPPEDTEATCDELERAARGDDAWVAVAHGLRALARLDAGDVGAAVGYLSRIDHDQLGEQLPQHGGTLLADVLATVYGRLRLHDRVDDVRAQAAQLLASRPPLEQAMHWAHTATELAVRALEPLASGGDVPDLALLTRAADVVTRLSTVPPDLVPERLRRGADGVRALAAAYRDRPEEALRLLGDDAFEQPEDLAWLERQVTTLAAIHAHLLSGGRAIARSLDDGAETPPSSAVHLVLEVCRARERLRLESRAGEDAAGVITRLSRLLAQLAWQSLDEMSGAVRQALAHQALRAQGRTDVLTGVGNRRALDEDLRNMLRFSPMPLSLVLADIDGFTSVNDRFGPAVGDEVLRRVAGSLEQQLRTGDRLMRYARDQFVVLLPLTSDTEARAVAERMASAVATLPWREVAQGVTIDVTTSSSTLWTLSHRRPDGDAEQLLREAGEQLLEAKHRRRSPHRAAAVAPDPGAGPSADLDKDAGADLAAGADLDLAAGAGLDKDAGRESPAEPGTALAARTPAAGRRRGLVAGSALEPARAPMPQPPRPPDPLHDPLPDAPSAGPLSPASGLPLYRALMQNPPRVDPFLGTLPPADPADRQLTPLGLALPTLPDRPARLGMSGPNGTNGTNGTNGHGAARPSARAAGAPAGPVPGTPLALPGPGSPAPASTGLSPANGTTNGTTNGTPNGTPNGGPVTRGAGGAGGAKLRVGGPANGTSSERLRSHGPSAASPRPSRQSTAADVRAAWDHAARLRAARAQERRLVQDSADEDDEPVLRRPPSSAAEPGPRPARPRRRPPIIDLAGDDDLRTPFG